MTGFGVYTTPSLLRANPEAAPATPNPANGVKIAVDCVDDDTESSGPFEEVTHEP